MAAISKLLILHHCCRDRRPSPEHGRPNLSGARHCASGSEARTGERRGWRVSSVDNLGILKKVWMPPFRTEEARPE